MLKSPQRMACGVCGFGWNGESSSSGVPAARPPARRPRRAGRAAPAPAPCAAATSSTRGAWSSRARRPAPGLVSVTTVHMRGMCSRSDRAARAAGWCWTRATGSRVAIRLPKRCRRPSRSNSSTAAPKKSWNPGSSAAARPAGRPGRRGMRSKPDAISCRHSTSKSAIARAPSTMRCGLTIAVEAAAPLGVPGHEFHRMPAFLDLEPVYEPGL